MMHEKHVREIIAILWLILATQMPSPACFIIGAVGLIELGQACAIHYREAHASRISASAQKADGAA